MVMDLVAIQLKRTILIIINRRGKPPQLALNTDIVFREGVTHVNGIHWQ